MCVDYRDELNAKTKHKDPYIIPRIDDTLDALGGAKYFCTLDLLRGYNQVELTEQQGQNSLSHSAHVTKLVGVHMHAIWHNWWSCHISTCHG